MADLEDVLARLGRLEAERDVCAVMADYLRRVDRREDIDSIGELFTEDAIWEAQGFLAEFGTTQGRSALEEMFAGLPASLSYTAHFATNPSVEVSEDLTSARGSWHTLELATTTTTPVEQIVMVAWYENDFALVDGRWRMSHVRFKDTAVFPYTEGWAATRFISALTLERTPHPES